MLHRWLVIVAVVVKCGCRPAFQVVQNRTIQRRNIGIVDKTSEIALINAFKTLCSSHLIVLSIILYVSILFATLDYMYKKLQ